MESSNRQSFLLAISELLHTTITVVKRHPKHKGILHGLFRQLEAKAPGMIGPDVHKQLKIAQRLVAPRNGSEEARDYVEEFTLSLVNRHSALKSL
jgi:hypothetical protein